MRWQNGIANWRDQNKAALNVRESILMNIKGKLRASINKEEVAYQPTQKGIGLIVASSVSFKDDCHQRTKSTKVFIKRREVFRTRVHLSYTQLHLLATSFHPSGAAPRQRNGTEQSRKSSRLYRKRLPKG